VHETRDNRGPIKVIAWTERTIAFRSTGEVTAKTRDQNMSAGAQEKKEKKETGPEKDGNFLL